MASFALSQASDQVEHLGAYKFHDTKGHNTLTADISGSNLKRAWVELALNGGSFAPMKRWTKSDLLDAITTAPTGTAISNISVREAFDVRYPTYAQDKLVVVWGVDGSPGNNLRWAESPDADPTAFTNAQDVAITDTDDPRMEDPEVIYDEYTDTLHLYYETSHTSDGEVGIYDADTREGKSYSNPRLIGNTHWDLGVRFASPTVWRHNDTYFISGEGHDTSDRDLIIAKGDTPTTFTDYIISADASDYSGIAGHINMQALYIDRDGTFHAYSNQELSGGTWASRHMETSTYSNGYPVEPWTMSADTTETYVISSILRLFNDMYVYGVKSSSKAEIYYWNIAGTRITKSLASDGGQVSFPYYEPTAPPGATVEWRVAVEDANGNIERSPATAFETGPPVERSIFVSQAGAVQTTNGVIRTSDGT